MSYPAFFNINITVDEVVGGLCCVWTFILNLLIVVHIIALLSHFLAHR